MKNIITCKNCGAENPFYRFICTNCNSYLRERIVNLDFFNLLGIMIESPSKAFQKIIFSEHKNFIYLVAVLVGIKLFINSLILSSYVKIHLFSDLVLNFFLEIILFIIFIFIYSNIIQLFSNLFGMKTRLKDNFSILVYSFVPMIYALIFLFPVELVLFGGNLFSSSPSPFIIKPIPAYILSLMEVIIIIWCFVLAFFAIKVTSGLKIFSFITAIIFVGGINLIPLLVLFA